MGKYSLSKTNWRSKNSRSISQRAFEGGWLPADLTKNVSVSNPQMMQSGEIKKLWHPFWLFGAYIFSCVKVKWLYSDVEQVPLSEEVGQLNGPVSELKADIFFVK